MNEAAPVEISSPAYEYASFWRRFFASFIDNIFFRLFCRFFEVVFGQYSYISVFLDFTLLALNFIYLQGKTGQTIGKKCVGIKVLKADFSLINYRIALLRYLALAFFFFGALFYGPDSSGFLVSFITFIQISWLVAELISMRTSSRNQTLHDKIANTVVVRT